MTIGTTVLASGLAFFAGSWPLIQFLNPVPSWQDPFRRGISPSQGLYIDTGQHRLEVYRHTCLEWEWKPGPRH
jgi:hypothetical protein